MVTVRGKDKTGMFIGLMHPFFLQGVFRFSKSGNNISKEPNEVKIAGYKLVLSYEMPQPKPSRMCVFYSH